MKTLFYVFVLLLPLVAIGQNEKPQLLGVVARTELNKEPYSEWFNKNYTDYKPNTTIVSELKKLKLKDYTVTVFLGTWCGDSHREVPRFIKILDEAGFPSSAVTLIGVSNNDSVYKQSPTRDEQGKHIYRVPTFIVYKNGVEVNRIVEFPITSLERDLLTILKGEEYTPNYKAYTYIIKWMNEGLLTNDDNVSYMGLANQLRYLTRSVGDLNSCGYVLMRSGAEGLKAAVKVFQINCSLYPDSYVAYSSLAEALGETGDTAKAAKMVERAIELNNDPQNVKYLLQLYDVVRDRVE